jgi:hypothetical protein
MSAAIYNATIDQGATFTLQVTYKDENGVPINLTGYTAAMQIRQNYNDSAALITLTSPSGGIVITGATGTINITISAEQTGSLDEGFYVYDLEITSTANVVTRLIQGQFTVAPEVTRV